MPGSAASNPTVPLRFMDNPPKESTGRRPQERRPKEPALKAAKQIVLVVDDELDICEAIRDVLEVSCPDVRVLMASSGPEALHVLEHDPVDAILSDYKMPEMNGIEFLREAGRRLPDVPRIMITAFPDMDVVIQAINEGHIETFLTKPVESDALVDTVQAVLAGRRAHFLRTRAFARSLESLQRQVQGMDPPRPGRPRA